MKKVLVIGATGYLGTHVVNELKRQGYWVRALVRDERKAKLFNEPVDDLFVGEATKPDTLDGICLDIDIIFSSLGITRQKDGLTYLDVDYQANKNILDLALKHNVNKFIYTSVLNAHKLSNLKIIHAKEKFVKSLTSSSIDCTIIRPSGFFSDMKEYLDMAVKGKAYIFGSGQNKINPINGYDLAEVCVEAIKHNDKELCIGGPEIFTHEQIVQLAFEIVDKPVYIIKVPTWLKNIILVLMRIFTSVKTYGPTEFLLSVLTMDMIGEQYGKHTLKEHLLSIVETTSNKT
ncbi:MAG: SDR family oxidoreductase [Flavobacteriales bacterium]|nr:SDR family oxidoreductase [Flavobacteriales bacterium]